MGSSSTIMGLQGEEVVSQTGTGSLCLTVMSSLDDMARHGAAWADLDRRSTAPLVFFQSFAWCHAWLSQHGRSVTPHVLTLYRGDMLVAVLPLMVERKLGGVRILKSVGAPHTQYSNILTATGELRADETMLLAQALHCPAVADCMEFVYLPETSPLRSLMPEGSAAVELDNVAAQFDLTQFRSVGDYRNTLSKSQRRSRKKALALLSSAGAVSLEVLRPHDNGYAEAIAQCIAWKRNWLKLTGRIGLGLEFSGHDRFLANIISESHPGGGMVFLLKAGGRPVALEVGFLQRGHYYSYLGGFDWRWRDASPGSMQIELSLEWMIENGIQCFDLLGTPFDYKSQWTNRVVPLSGHTINFSPKGAAYSALWTRMLRPAAKSAYGKLPTGLRTGFAVLRKMKLHVV
jgi:CelD/BcsL family acetyltransferase involved in cellulose biosynthesis